MTPQEIQEFVGLLNDSTRFNTRYLNSGGSMFDWDFPKGNYSGLRMNSFHFSKIRFEQGTVFANTHFHNCVFENSQFTDIHFKSCKFTKCFFAHSEFQAFDSENNEFDSSRFEYCEFGDTKVKASLFRLGHMRSHLFENCKLDGVGFEKVKTLDLRFKNPIIDNAVFSGMVFSPGAFEAVKIKEVQFFFCSFEKHIPKNLMETGRAFFNDSKIENIHTTSDGAFWNAAYQFSLENSSIQVAAGEKNAVFTGLVNSQVEGASGMEELNFSGAQISGSKLSGFQGSRMRCGLEANLTDTQLENLDFEEIEWDNLIFTRCTLKNIRARKSLVLDKTQFIDCKFENFTLDAGGTYSAKGTPFESSLPK